MSNEPVLRPLRVLLAHPTPQHALDVLARIPVIETVVRSGLAAEEELESDACSVALVELNAARHNGGAGLRNFRSRHPDTPVILLADSRDEEAALEMLSDADDYLLDERLDEQSVAGAVRQALRIQELRGELRRHQQELRAYVETLAELRELDVESRSRILFVHKGGEGGQRMGALLASAGYDVVSLLDPGDEALPEAVEGYQPTAVVMDRCQFETRSARPRLEENEEAIPVILLSAQARGIQTSLQRGLRAVTENAPAPESTSQRPSSSQSSGHRPTADLING